MIINIINFKIYIGKHQTKDLYDSYMGSGKLLRKSFKKYSLENFIKGILFVFDNEDEMNDKEAELVDEVFCLREDTYNICTGGKGGWGYVNSIISNSDRKRFGKSGGKIGGPISQKILKERRKIIEYSEKYSKNISDSRQKFYAAGGIGSFTGKKHTDKTKQRISSSNHGKQSGKRNSQFGSMWITNGFENKKINKNNFIPNGWYCGRKMRTYSTQ